MAKKDIAFTNVAKPYLRPRWGGIDRLDMYIDGMGQFLSDRGDDDITMGSWSGDKTADETEDVIKAQIDAGWPIPTWCCITTTRTSNSTTGIGSY